jgi:hypothetical protein
VRRTTLICLVLLGCLASAGILAAQDQEPPPYQGNDSAQPPPDQGAGPAPSGEDATVASVDYFHDQLSPYGQWVVREGYGQVWVPNVANGWRPYTTGHWIHTDQGWAWVADENWGWAAFHYGRWYYDREIGWGWLPGTVWAPAWVAWRSGGGYLGWAPLGPTVGFSARIGLGAELTVGIGPGFFTFCSQRDFLSPRINTYIMPSSRNLTIVNNTVNITNYTVVNNHIVNGGVSVTQIQQATGRPVETVRVATLATGGVGGHGAFYQPPVVARAAAVGHAEFGGALAAQVKVQQRSQSYAQVSRNSAAVTSSIAKNTARTGNSQTNGNSLGNSNRKNKGGQSGVQGLSNNPAGKNASSTTGTSHATGATGTSHTSHATGSTGATGTSHSTGKTGATGSTGATHATGGTGANGSTGGTSHATGNNGSTGSTGSNSAAHHVNPPPPPKSNPKPPPPKEEKEKKPPVV